MMMPDFHNRKDFLYETAPARSQANIVRLWLDLACDSGYTASRQTAHLDACRGAVWLSACGRKLLDLNSNYLGYTEKVSR